MNRRIILLAAGYLLIILVFAWLRPTEIDWTPTFSPEQKIPFASRILFERLPDIRSEEITSSTRPIFNTLRNLTDTTGHCYFFVNSSLDLSQLDLDQLLDFVQSGNNVFISTDYYPHILLDTLHLFHHVGYLDFYHISDWFYEDNLSLGLVSIPDSTWPAASRSGYRWFESADSLTVLDTLGVVDEEYPNYVRVPFGQGAFYLHAFPYVFTNYHMLYLDNHRYVSGALGALPAAETWIWDRYYAEEYLRTARTPLAAFNQYLSFRWAYWTGIIALLIFILFTAKRKQRVIPVLKSKRNRTLDYVRTIGDLYFHRSDHADLVKKKIALLKSHLHKKFRLDIQAFSHEDALAVAGRSGIAPEEVGKLFRTVREADSLEKAQVRDLQALQIALDTFWQRSIKSQ